MRRLGKQCDWMKQNRELAYPLIITVSLTTISPSPASFALQKY